MDPLALGILASGIVALVVGASGALWQRYSATHDIQAVLDMLCRTAPKRVRKLQGNTYLVVLDPKETTAHSASCATITCAGLSVTVTVTLKGRTLLRRQEYTKDQFYNLLRKAELYARANGVEALSGYARRRAV